MSSNLGKWKRLNFEKFYIRFFFIEYEIKSEANQKKMGFFITIHLNLNTHIDAACFKSNLLVEEKYKPTKSCGKIESLQVYDKTCFALC